MAPAWGYQSVCVQPRREHRMERRQIGVVQELFRYPVKSMLGERLREVDIGAHGVIGDRAYALREGNGRVVTAKKWANMFAFCARYDAPSTPGALGPLRITLPAGQTIHAPTRGRVRFIQC